ncbi:MAG: hypothetical protein GYB65_19530 [Chloroflexi bacterium]|nr:hypothetical protein [Chloroflexota bacterium]
MSHPTDSHDSQPDTTPQTPNPDPPPARVKWEVLSLVVLITSAMMLALVPDWSEVLSFGGDDDDEPEPVEVGYAWEQFPAAGPGPRANYSLAFDHHRGQFVLFGGIARWDDPHVDTWEWAAGWTLQVPATAPPARDLGLLVYFPPTDAVVLFGGRDLPAGVAFDDTWTYNGEVWTQLSPVTSPGPRFSTCGTYDAARGQLILFGGEHIDGTKLAETWAYDGQTWTQFTPDPVPPARALCAMAYDPVRERAVLFGGLGTDGTLGDTWEWDGAAWQQVEPATAPSARMGAAMIYHAGLGQILLYGGDSGACGTLANQTWTWDGAAWAAPDIPDAGPRSVFGMAYDPERDLVLLYGGWSGGTGECAVNDTTYVLRASE